MAEKAIKYTRSMALEPMNSYERHVIHTALQNYEGVTTSSTGVEPNRRVVVSYVRPEKAEGKPERSEARAAKPECPLCYRETVTHAWEITPRRVRYSRSAGGGGERRRAGR